MTISAVSSVSSGVDGSSTTLQQLEKQRQALVQELQKEQDSKDDAKTKQALLQELHAQIGQIDLQIAQSQSRQRRSAQKAAEPSASRAAGGAIAGILDALA